MQLHRSFGQAKLGQSNIVAQDRFTVASSSAGILDRNFFFSSFLVGWPQDLHFASSCSKIVAALPRPMFVGVGQRGASRSRWQTRCRSFPSLAACLADFTQDLRAPTDKKHGNELTQQLKPRA